MLELYDLAGADFQVLAADDPVAQWRGRMLGLFDGLAGKAKGYPV